MSKSSHAKKTRPLKSAPTKQSEPLPVEPVDLDRIDPSPQNRDPGSLDDLIASVRQHGVQQPIKLRPKGDRLEIVYGERRLQAARKIGLTSIPATIEDLSDEEALTLRIVENACRASPHPLDEAESYEQLLAMKNPRGEPSHTVDSLAELVGRSAQYVYARLKLTALGSAMRKTFREGQLTVTTAFLVARAVPLDLQDEALAEFRELFADEEGAPFPADELAFHIEQNYLTRLERAPFSLKDAKLLPKAGPCTTCPKRSGNQPGLFDDGIPKDTCSDRTCFRAKLEAHRQNLAANVVTKGGVVLSEPQSNEIYRGAHQLPWNGKHIDVDVPCMEDPSGRTWRKLLGDLCPKLTLATDPRGVPHALALRHAALAALNEAGVDLASIRKDTSAVPREASSREGDDAGNKDPAAARAAAELRRATVVSILGAIATAAESRPADDPTFASLILDSMTQGGYHDAIADTVKRLGLTRANGETPDEVLGAHARGLDAKGLRALILELSLARGAYFAWSKAYSERLVAAAAAYSVDIPAIEKRTAEEIEVKRAQRSTRKAPKASPLATG